MFSVFRDCSNLKQKAKQYTPLQSYNTQIKILAYPKRA